MELGFDAHEGEQAFAPTARPANDVDELAALLAAIFRIDVRDSRALASRLYPYELGSAA